MTLSENLRLGMTALLAQKLRSFLTMLGIIFGVGAVVAMQSIGAGARKEMLDAIRMLGVNNIIIQATELSGEERRVSLTKNPKQLFEGDVLALRSTLSTISQVVPLRRREATTRLPADTRVNLVGTTPEYMDLLNLDVVEGRFLHATDFDEKQPVTVITDFLKRELFPLEPAVGKRLKVQSAWFTVVGVVRVPEGTSNMGGFEIPSMERDVYLPLSAMETRFPHESQRSPLQSIIVQAENEDQVRAMAVAIERILARRHRNTADFDVIVPVELLKQSQQTQRIFNIVMGAIASISLLVGGIGIMNIMLSNVLERTREIGVRRAVGATRRNVVSQFLLEAMLLSVLGGLIGVILGGLMAWAITLYAGWTTVVGLWAILLAFGVSAGVGILFGWWPAKKAADMNVINAIRYE